MLLTFSKIALGVIPEQILRRKGLLVLASDVQKYEMIIVEL